MKITIETNITELNEQTVIEAIHEEDIASLEVNLNSEEESALISAAVRAAYDLYSSSKRQVQAFVDLNCSNIELAFGEVIGPEVTPEESRTFFLEIDPS